MSLSAGTRWIKRDFYSYGTAASDSSVSLFHHTLSHNYLPLLFQWSPEEELILTKLTFIGSGASLCALLVTLMLFTVLE